MDEIMNIIADIERFIKEPEQFIKKDIHEIFETWKKYLLRIYFLNKDELSFMIKLKIKMLQEINFLFNRILKLDLEKENLKIELLIEENGLKPKIDALAEIVTKKYIKKEQFLLNE